MNEDKDKVDNNEKKKAKTNERQYINIFLLCIYQTVITQCHFSISAYYLKCECWDNC